jgi:hypothetical protein
VTTPVTARPRSPTAIVNTARSWHDTTVSLMPAYPEESPPSANAPPKGDTFWAGLDEVAARGKLTTTDHS